MPVVFFLLRRGLKLQIVACRLFSQWIIQLNCAYRNFPESEVTSSVFLFYPTNSPKPRDLSFTVMNDTTYSHIFRSWYHQMLLEKRLKQWSGYYNSWQLFCPEWFRGPNAFINQSNKVKTSSVILPYDCVWVCFCLPPNHRDTVSSHQADRRLSVVLMGQNCWITWGVWHKPGWTVWLFSVISPSLPLHTAVEPYWDSADLYRTIWRSSIDMQSQITNFKMLYIDCEHIPFVFQIRS